MVDFSGLDGVPPLTGALVGGYMLVHKRFGRIHFLVDDKEPKMRLCCQCHVPLSDKSMDILCPSCRVQLNLHLICSRIEEKERELKNGQTQRQETGRQDNYFQLGNSK